jgi:hypothetical protein
MIASDLARAAVVGVFLGIDLSGHLTFGAVLVLGACGLGVGFFQPAFGGIIPLVVEAPMLPSANSRLGIARQGRRLTLVTSRRAPSSAPWAARPTSRASLPG